MAKLPQADQISVRARVRSAASLPDDAFYRRPHFRCNPPPVYCLAQLKSDKHESLLPWIGIWKPFVDDKIHFSRVSVSRQASDEPSCQPANILVQFGQSSIRYHHFQNQRPDARMSGEVSLARSLIPRTGK